MDRGTDGAAKARIELVELGEDEAAPELAVFAIRRGGELLHRADVGADGTFDLPKKALAAAEQVVIGPNVETLEGIDRDSLSRFHIDEIREVLKAKTVLEIPRRKWGEIAVLRRCVDGSVSRCYPYPWFTNDLLSQASKSVVAAFDESTAATARLKTLTPARDLASASDALIAAPKATSIIHSRCDVVCDGLVEVYRRTCCCTPLIIDDPRLDELHRRLEDLIDRRPPIKWPPPPRGPFEDLSLFKGGVVDEPLLYAERDALALRSLQGAAVVDYVAARPYLKIFWCLCGAATKVGQGPIRPDGTFHVCFNGPRWLPSNCDYEYAFVVRQTVNGETITIYDGLAAHRWFSTSSGIELVSYDPRARGCRDNSFPGTSGAFVLLEDIGSAHGYRLKTPLQDSWDGVAAPDYNDGLLDPAANAAAAKGQYLDRNWGGTLALQYHFSEPMKAAGARFYRISVTRADAAGNPSGTPTPLQDALSWLYYEVVGTDIDVGSDVLGPVPPVGGQSNLYRIPYDADRDWQSGQFHGFLDTTQFADGRFLVTLEVFDATGQRIRPTGSSGPGNDVPFTFRRWFQPTGPTANVPFAALTQMFWWDNQPAVGHIYDLRKNGVASSDECQFLYGLPGSLFSAGYRAYHPDSRFVLNHTLWWRRGLGGPSGTLINSPDNAGQPPAALAVTPPVTFASMLGSHTKCSFSLNLQINVKTTNGSGTLDYLDASDQAAFALDQSAPAFAIDKSVPAFALDQIEPTPI